MVPQGVDRPNDQSCHVHQHSHRIAACQNFSEPRQKGQEAADCQAYDEEGENETNAVDGDAPLERVVPCQLCSTFVVQAHEDDAGHKGLQDLELPRDCGQKAADRTSFSPGETHLGGVQTEDQKGNNSGGDTFAACEGSVEENICEEGSQQLRDRQKIKK